jgi:glycerophosphoryl diester phosphodiesterase
MASARILPVLTLAMLAVTACTSEKPAGSPPTPVNQPPQVTAGPAQQAASGAIVTLSGTATDPDGTVVAVQWTQVSGEPSVELQNADQLTATFTAPEVSQNTELVFRLTATDNEGASGSDTTTVTVTPQPVENQPPNADAGPDQSVVSGDTVLLDGSNSADPDGSIVAFEWTRVSGPEVELAGAGTAIASFTAPEVETATDIVFNLKVTDDAGATDNDEVTVTVHPAQPPVADAGADQTVTAGDTVELDGSNSTDPKGGDLEYLWEQVGGMPTVELQNDTSSIASFVAPAVEELTELTFRLTVQDSTGAGDSDTTVVTVLPPVAERCVAGTLCVGAAKRSITPSQQHIDGIPEPRFGGEFGAPSTHLQKFNLGGYGIDLGQNFPNPLDEIPAEATSTTPAGARVFDGSQGEEHTHLRVMVIEQPGGDRVAFLMIDAVGAGNLIHKGLKEAVNEAACALDACFAPSGTSGDQIGNILFGQTHTHAGADLQGLWGGVPEDWIRNHLYVGAADAVREALANRASARLTLRQGHTNDFNNYRRPRINPDIDADSTLSLLTAINSVSETIIGSILQYNAHPTSITDSASPRIPHADYIQGAMDWLEDETTGVGGVALYFNGPIADASPSGGRPGCDHSENNVGDGAGYGTVRCRGEGIASTAQQFEERELGATLRVDSRSAVLPITNPAFIAAALAGAFNRYYDFLMLPVGDIPGIGSQFHYLPQLTPVASTLVTRVTIGGAEQGLEIVTIPGETTGTFGDYIRSLANTDVMLLGLTQNSFGYILPEEEFSYVDQRGNAGFILPFTGYEENVSLGPLTAPLLRIQAYNPLFGAAPERNLPPTITSCLDDPDNQTCILAVLQNRADLLAASLEACQAGGLAAPGCPTRETVRTIIGGFGAIAEGCHEFEGPEPLCEAFDGIVAQLNEIANTGAGGDGGGDASLLVPALEAQTRGCDLLDASNCLYPFPNDWFTAPAAPGSIQDQPRGTGRRVNIHPLATPRNTFGKPVDPTEWNRNDGFSPGALIATYVPGLSLERTFNRPSHEVGLANIALSQDPDAPILVLEVQDGAAPVKHLVWSEIDQNANQLTNAGLPNVGTFPIPGVTNEYGHIERPLGDGKAALLIRPAKNFSEGRRYVVVLRQLRDDAGNPIRAQAGFQACLQGDSVLPPVQARCAQLQEYVFPVLDAAGIARDESLYLAWDFTVASTESVIGRLRHMRDDAFRTLSGNPQAEDCTQLTPANAAVCAAPKIDITGVRENPQGGIARRIEGTITVPNYLAPIGPSPLDDPKISSALNQLCADAPEGEFQSGCLDLRSTLDLGQGLALPNRLFYSPADGTPTPDPNNPFDPTGLRYGDGLPDRNGTMTTRFLCQIPAQATPDNPARASLYGHGQLDRAYAITYEGTPDVAREFNYMFCAVDWFGFRTGDAANVLSTLVDMSNFAVIPDASQQGMLNFMFLARAMGHPQGFAALSEFQDPESGRPVFDRSEIFYNGNSQGGIFGGVVLAASKDVKRGVLGSLGMNYSTLLTRSKNFDEYAGILYGSYTDPLDRQLLFSMVQMLWDRSENNGYASHLIDNTAFGGPSNAVKLDPQFGDPQVTMWSAEVMARTMGAPFDNRQTLRVETLDPKYLGVNGRRHPDVEPYFGLQPLDYNDPQQTGGSALIVWDTNHRGEYSDIPPTTNTPPRTGPDNHDASQLARFGRCNMAHFMRTGGQLIDTLPVQFDGAPCPAVPPAEPTTASPAPPPTGGGFMDAFDRWVEALGAGLGNLTDGDLIGAYNGVVGGTQQFVADLYSDGAQQLGGAAGLTPPGSTPDAVNNPPPQPLMAGVAKGPIRVPVGTPLGGYLRPPVGGEYIGPDPFGELFDNVPYMADACDPGDPQTCPPLAPLPDELRAIHSPYTTYAPPSRGYYDSLIAKAVALHDGHDYVVLVKTDFIGMLDEVVQDVKAEVKARTGIDLGDGLILSATHTHGGPGALANHSTRYFWLAMDVYQHDVYRRLIPQLADVVVAALGNLRPARIGHGTGAEVEGLNGYRRGRLGSYDLAKNNELLRRIGVLRVDDAGTGEPMAVVINWAAHGIAFDVENMYFSGDVLGAVERETERLMQLPVAMLVQSVGGDVSPRGVSNDNKLQRIESYGRRLAPQVAAVAQSITAFQDAPDLRAVSQRVILNRERLGYAEDEYPYPWGAGQCGNDIAVPFAGVGVKDIPGYSETGLPVKNPFCLPSPPPDAIDLADNGVAENGAFYPQDAILYAVKIGNIKLLVQPGEPLVEYGVRLLDMAEAAGYQRNDVFIWGYSADHIGYILPPEEEDWATFGGAESTTTFWGWLQGHRFLEVSQDLLLSLRDGTAPPPNEFEVNYGLYKAFYDATPTPPAFPSLLPGTVIEQPSDILRFQATRFVFEGGDPVLDFPEVEMQQFADGQWEPVRRANGDPLRDFFEMHLKYRLVSARHLWTVEFEAPRDWPAGTYRFVVSGRASRGMEQPYALESAAFTVAQAANLQIAPVACDGSACQTELKYTPQPTNYRVIDPYVPNNQAAPVRQGMVEFLDATGTVVATATCAPPLSADCQAGRYRVTVAGVASARGADAYGNTTPAGGGTTPPPPPPPDSDTPQTGASLLGHCRASSPDQGFCDEFEAQMQPFVDNCSSGGSQFGDEEAEAFCHGVLTGDLDQLIRLCDLTSPQPQICLPIQSLADVLATRNPWLARRILNISHRGGALEFPENTLYAYAKSLEAGSHMIEADVYQTADGELVVIHDASVDRTTEGSGGVSSMTLAQLKALDAAYCFRPNQGSSCNASLPDSAFPLRGIATGAVPPPPGFTENDFRIPTLRELLARFPDTLINLELKPDPQGAGSYEGKMAALLAEFGRAEDVIVASFLDSASAVFKAQAPLVSTSVPTVQVAASIATGQGPSPGITVGHEAFQVPINFSGIPVTDRAFVEDAHAQGLAVHVWTINDCNTMVDLLDMGVDGIMTDRPSLLNELLTKPREQWPCTGSGTGPGEPGESGDSQGLIETLAGFFSELWHAFVALVTGDFDSAQTHFLAALEYLGNEGPETITGEQGSLLALVSDYAASLQVFFDQLQEDPAAAPEAAEALAENLVGGMEDFAGVSWLATPDDASCAPDHTGWEGYSELIGSLHQHSGFSDGAVGAEPADYYAAGRALGMDYMGGSEHSDNLRLPFTADQNCIAQFRLLECVQTPEEERPLYGVTKWEETLVQAQAATDADFTAFRGFEWTSDRFGHINVFFSRHDWNAKSTEGYTLSMESFWTWFTLPAELGGGRDGLAVFNHPGREDMIESSAPNLDPAYAFNDFEYRPEAGLRFVGVEVFGKGSDTYDLMNGAPDGGWYAYALDRGWRLGPVGAEDEHGTSWAQPNRAKTVLIARDRTEPALREAMFARRFYALAQNHNDIRLRFTGDGQPMGARLARAPGTPVLLEGMVAAGAGVTKLELVTTGGEVLVSQTGTVISKWVTAEAGERWYYLRAHRADGRPVAYSAPIWVQARDAWPVCGE